MLSRQYLLVALAIIGIFSSASFRDDAAEAIIPEAEFVQVPQLAEQRPSSIELTTVDAHMSTKAASQSGAPFGATCNVDVERCFVNEQTSESACQACNAMCVSLAAKKAAAEEIVACKKGCDSKCIWVKATTEFHGSYVSLCAEEIVVKQERDEKSKKKEKGEKEKKAKDEKKAKGAYEGMAKCREKENSSKKAHELDVKSVMRRVKHAQEVDSKLSKRALEGSAKQHAAFSKAEKALYKKELDSKEQSFKAVKKAKDESEKNVKKLRESIFKKAKISKFTQELIYKKWQSHLAILKTTPHVVPAPKPAPAPVVVPAPKPEEVTEPIPPSPKLPEEKCKCQFPFTFQGTVYYKCAEGAGHEPFCLDASQAVQACPKNCKAVWKTPPKPKPPTPKPSPPAPAVVVAPVPVPAPAPFVPLPEPQKAPSIYEVKTKNEEKQLSILKEQLAAAQEKSDKATFASAEKKLKCKSKQENIEKQVESKTKSEKAAKTAALEKPKMEKGAKERKFKEKTTKEAVYKQELANKVATEKTRKEGATKVAAFKMKESKAKEDTKEKKEKNPFITLDGYCARITKMKEVFAKTKAEDSMRIKELAKKKVETVYTLTHENEIKTKEIVSKQCRNTKEVCSKISTTSERKEKHGAKVAQQMKAKMEAKCALTLKVQKAEQHNIRMAVCQAAHAELTHVIKSIQTKETGAVASLRAQLPVNSH